MLHAKTNKLHVVGGWGGLTRVKVLEIKSRWSGKRREMLLQPPRIIPGGGSESVFLSFVFMFSCSPHRDDNQLTSQCFKLSSLQKQISESP